MVELPDDMIVDGFEQIEPAIGLKEWSCLISGAFPQVGRGKLHHAVLQRLERRVGIVIDGSVQNCAAELIAVRRHIRASPGKPEP